MLENWLELAFFLGWLLHFSFVAVVPNRGFKMPEGFLYWSAGLPEN